MKDQIASKIYARAILEIGQEKSVNLAEELIKLTEIINSSAQLENVMFLDVFTAEEKKEVFTAVAGKAGLSQELQKSILYLIDEKRTNLIPLISKEAMIIDDERRGFMRGVIEGSEVNVDQKLVEQVKAFLKTKLGREPQIDYVQNNSITAGYKITVDDLQLDASLENRLNQFKKSVISE